MVVLLPSVDFFSGLFVVLTPVDASPEAVEFDDIATPDYQTILYENVTQ